MNRDAVRHLLALVCAGWMVLPAVSAAPAAAPPVEAFFQNVEVGAAEISPNGRYVLARVSVKGVRRSLALFDLATMTPKVLARYADGDVGKVFWLNDKRIAFTVINIDRRVESTTSGLYAIDLDGKQSEGLTPAVAQQRSFADNEELQGPGGGSDAIQGNWPALSDSMPVRFVSDGVTTISSLDTRTGRRTPVRAPTGSVSWLYDDAGLLRVTVARDGDQHSLRLLDADHYWRKLSSFAPTSGATLYPRAYVGGTLYVQAQNGGERSSLFRYNVERRALDEPALINSPEFDIDASAISEGSRLLGFRINTDAESTVWFDPAMKALQAEIDALLPATINRVDRGSRSETPFVLVKAYSPVHPGDTLVFNRDTKKFTRLGTALPGIVPEQMASPLPVVRYKARDGMSIPVQVTLPKGEQKSLPTVVLVAAYPWARNSAWAFDPQVQFLVSRGYAVIQPQARGRRGFGAAHLEAGMRQWGLAMQDDLADGAKWAIAQGIADPKRICIAGTVYGGYAAMMGLIKNPELFRCGVSWAGIVDIGLMFRSRWDDFPTAGYGGQIKLLVGDPAKDQAQFDATSPLKNAQRITRPVLLAYGAKDAEVPGKHGRLLYEAIKPGNPDAELIMFDENGQPPSLDNNRAALWTRIEQFLDRHIGPAAASHL
jgi:dipeptidyl aminopeptidase/acylaminoacyl peptidase